MAIQIAVCGPAEASEAEHEQAREVGGLLARRGVVVICGGYGGVMAAAAAGARDAGGTAVGVLSRADREGANPDLTITIATGMGQARNAVIVDSADAVIVVGGSWGTLSEVALALRRGTIPVVCLGGWRVETADGHPAPDGPLYVSTAHEAVDAAMAGLTD
ncbi:MAG: TIGR00725 family protein [Catenulispora sp.]|nr:TIGR00725 family protein [Catenulispora sp.]